MRLKAWEPADATGLALFRKLFAIGLVIQVLEFYAADVVNRTFILNHMRIPFHFSDWIPVLPGKLMHLPFLCQIAGALLLFTEKHARRGAFIHFISFTYVILLDISYYNNHFYFISLLSLFFIFYHPHTLHGSIQVHSLLLYMFRFQVIVVYFFGGLAKINYDWIVRQEPMRQMLSNTLGSEPGSLMVFFYAYGGLLFDLLIGFMLLAPRSRNLAVILTIVFHLSNLLMFETGKNVTIGIFPFLMIATNLLFVDANRIRSLFGRLAAVQPAAKKEKKSAEAFVPSLKAQRMLYAAVAVFIALQLFLPLRHLLIKGNVDWTNEGYYFAWRMKIRSKEARARITVKDLANGRTTLIEPYRFLNTLQFKAVCEDPAAMHYFIRHLREKAFSVGMQQPAFFVSWTCSMNRRPAQAVVDSSADFLSFRFSPAAHNSWILPLRPVEAQKQTGP